MWIYSQSSGQLWDGIGEKIAVGYSGHKEGLNNPKLQAVKSVGPAPRGLWVLGSIYNSQNIGPLAIVMEPHEHDALGRTYFRIHGDNRHMNQSASHGCLIFPRSIRERIWDSGDKLLMVVE